MLCGTEAPTSDPFASITETDPLSTQTITDSSEDEAKLDYASPSLNLKVYKIPNYNNPNLTIYPTTPNALPKFVNNPLNLANPLALTSFLNKPLQNNRFSLPNIRKSPPPLISLNHNKSACETNGNLVRYKKNGEVAKKRGPPKGYKRKPKTEQQSTISIQTLTNNLLLQAQNTILTSLLASQAPVLVDKTIPNKIIPASIKVPAQLTIVPQIKVPKGVELLEMALDPSDWFPEEPYRMVFSRKKNPKWKEFPFRCEHCFKGYRVASTLISHSAERHGSVPKQLAIPCPCCAHVSTRRCHHVKHLTLHATRRGKLFCQYCVPMQDPSETFVKVSERFPYKKFPQYWYASEESLRLHKKRKHPYAAMFNYNWYCTWTDAFPNS